MSSELTVLGRALVRLAQRDRHSRDFTRNNLTDALREVIACFPLYRTYITAEDISLHDRACVEVAVAFAKRRNPATTVALFDFVKDVLLLRYPASADRVYRDEQLAFVQKFQQVTSPVTAKGVEDTAFYRYNRLVSLNEVGGDPSHFGSAPEEVHRRLAERQSAWPAALSASSTHDTKRGEDVRARINALSEMPRRVARRRPPLASAEPPPRHVHRGPARAEQVRRVRPLPDAGRARGPWARWTPARGPRSPSASRRTWARPRARPRSS